MDDMIRQRIERLVGRRRCTLLGVGPMSVNCVDASIELANEHDIPIFLIASRRQIDSEAHGGGYVNRWTTREFAAYVTARDKKSNVILARDHGGPWQNPTEVEAGLSLRLAMDSAKASYLEDLRAGFQKIHIDPSIDLHGGATVDDIIDRIVDLYEFCWSHAQTLGREVVFEIGTEEQTGSTSGSEAELDYVLAQVKDRCRQEGLPLPTFVVVQTGTKVMETRNVGSFDSPVRVANELAVEIQVPKMLEVCRTHGVMLKQHNTDYLSDESLKWHPRLGIHSANVAPEFGVAETRTLLRAFDDAEREDLAERFVRIAVASGKWRKWVLPESRLRERELASICGHYVFSDPEVIDLKRELDASLPADGPRLDERLKAGIKQSILRYLHNFRLVA
jgi:tagatose-1,6-bisphosphate aldolase non-catalytic subunit AgaZ/GatZ